MHVSGSSTSCDNHELVKEAVQSLITAEMARSSSATRVPAYKFANDTKTTVLRTSMEKFPEIDTQQGQSQHLWNGNGFVNSPSPLDRWQSRRDSSLGRSTWRDGQTTGGKGHSRQKSLSDAFRTIRGRKASTSANIHEISDALKAPVSPRLIVSTVLGWRPTSNCHRSSV